MEKSEFIKQFKKRTKKLSLDIILLINTRKKTEATKIISHQIIKSATSTAANYRAACIARSKKEFYSKISITIEEADETVFWLELLQESNLASNQNIVPLLEEANTIVKVLSKARKNTSF
ncbi:four helix bundle protein [Aquimarina sp. U1-2]|uniref:four helix bundle protein n=1 Tax=Aquimarina sp. U1-2 TaxID=2823141 RepID=UPI001AEC80AE|nr:four helix bundle protein [Aquimarina sp. U1-2]MBP2833435.1 four helix bundle protein [Aquimarina sp. U1-2]